MYRSKYTLNSAGGSLLREARLLNPAPVVPIVVIPCETQNTTPETSRNQYQRFRRSVRSRLNFYTLSLRYRTQFIFLDFISTSIISIYYFLSFFFTISHSTWVFNSTLQPDDDFPSPNNFRFYVFIYSDFNVKPKLVILLFFFVSLEYSSVWVFFSSSDSFDEKVCFFGAANQLDVANVR